MRLRAALLGAAGLLACAGIARGEAARQDYQLHCMGCHGEDGRGLDGKVPSLRAELARLLASPGGREFVLRVPGVSQSALSSEKLAAVLNWLVREYTDASTAAGIRPFTAAEAQRLRRQPLLDVAAARAQL